VAPRARVPQVGGGVPAAPGEAVQVDPIKPVLKAPGTKRLILQSDEPLSNFAFKFNLRRYTPDVLGVTRKYYPEAGSYTPPLLSST